MALSADTSDIDTPDDMYCKLPQDSPLSVRGARNYPCMDKPGKRAPTVEICKSDKPYMPLAMRQHTLGPTPRSQPARAGHSARRPGHRQRQALRPTEGTPLPPGAIPRGTPPGPRVRLRHQARWERLHRRSRHRDRRRRSSHRSPVRFHPLRHLTSPRRVSRPAISLAATYDSAARQCQRRAAASGAECIRHDQGISATSGDRKV
ncbi:mce family domain protein [Mycobacterium xenopi 4042]|uniref:Mce family domain protein n=1 Tax=Mycobacterium xenopi 4042 TaxID=1299334 RepID=X8AFM6_MYCXE|nr:mce family domain protein [Mycobacterium xenopi 4042]